MTVGYPLPLQAYELGELIDAKVLVMMMREPVL
jgi:hypothetical protein